MSDAIELAAAPVPSGSPGERPIGPAPQPADDFAAGSPKWVERFTDRLNPVLVKEVRQAQRGKVFSIALISIVLVTLIACAFMAVDQGVRTPRPGREFFSLVYVFLGGAVLLVVPFQAFSSMGSEWDDHTFEMLVLSNLKPRQIVLGKILAAFLQGSLLFAAFLPFLAVAFLMQGVDLLALAVVLALTMYACLWFSTIAIMLSTCTRNRLLRVLFMASLAAGLASSVTAASVMAQEAMRSPDIVTDWEFWAALPQVLAVTTLAGIFAFCVSCNLLAHEEENRSTNLRILVSAGLVVFLGLLSVNVASTSIGMPREAAFGLTVFTVFVVAFACVFFCSEPERLGRRVAPSVPRGRLAAFLTFPWFPGAGRGVAYLMLHLGILTVVGFLLAACAEVSPWRSTSGRQGLDLLMDSGGAALLVSLVFAVLYTIVPIGIMTRFLGDSKPRRKIVRTVAVFSPLIYLLIPGIAGMVIGDQELRSWKHSGNPGWVLDQAMAGEYWSLAVFSTFMASLALLGLAISLPKVLRAAAETSGARAAAAALKSEGAISVEP